MMGELGNACCAQRKTSREGNNDNVDESSSDDGESEHNIPQHPSPSEEFANTIKYSNASDHFREEEEANDLNDDNEVIDDVRRDISGLIASASNREEESKTSEKGYNTHENVDALNSEGESDHDLPEQPSPYQECANAGIYPNAGDHFQKEETNDLNNDQENNEEDQRNSNCASTDLLQEYSGGDHFEEEEENSDDYEDLSDEGESCNQTLFNNQDITAANEVIDDVRRDISGSIASTSDREEETVFLRDILAGGSSLNRFVESFQRDVLELQTAFMLQMALRLRPTFGESEIETFSSDNSSNDRSSDEDSSTEESSHEDSNTEELSHEDSSDQELESEASDSDTPSNRTELIVTDVQEHTGNCSICLDDSGLDWMRVSCPSSHTFHKECISRWLSIKMSCPYCRHKFK